MQWSLGDDHRCYVHRNLYGSLQVHNNNVLEIEVGGDRKGTGRRVYWVTAEVDGIFASTMSRESQGLEGVSFFIKERNATSSNCCDRDTS